MHSGLSIVVNLFIVLFAVTIGIVAGLTEVYCLNKPLPPFGWVTNVLIEFAITAGNIILIWAYLTPPSISDYCRRLIESSAIRAAFRVGFVLLAAVLLGLTMSGDNPTHRPVLNGPIVKTSLLFMGFMTPCVVGSSCALLVMRYLSKRTVKATGSRIDVGSQIT